MATLPIEAARRWPRLTAQVIVASAGYFTAQHAASAIAHCHDNTPHRCELYEKLLGWKGTPDAYRRLNREFIARAFQFRHEPPGMIPKAVARRMVDEMLARAGEDRGGRRTVQDPRQGILRRRRQARPL